MPIRFYCPLGHRLVVPDERAGKKGRCPQCHQRVYVPVADPQPRGGPKQPAADQSIEIDATEGVPPAILSAPAAGTMPRGGNGQRAAQPGAWSSKAAGSAAPQAAAKSMDPNDPLAMALEEIGAMERGRAVGSMPPPAELSSASGSVSNILPPPAATGSTAPAAAPSIAPAAPSIAPAAVLPPAAAAPPPAPPASPPRPAAGPGYPSVPPAAVAIASASVPMAAAFQAAAPYSAPAPMPAIQAYAPPRRGWIRPADPEEVAGGYQPEGTRLQMVYLLASVLMVLALMASWPAMMHFRRTEPPAWVGLVLLMSAAQLVYIVWLLTLPDWSTLRLGMMLCAACAAAYACGLAIVFATPDSRVVVLGLDDVRESAGMWCAVQFGLLGAVCYGFGYQASAWRDDIRGVDDRDW